MSTLTRLLYMCGVCMAMSMDFCMGAFIASTTGVLFNITPTLPLLLIGGILGFLPDFDLIAPVIRRVLGNKKVVGNHHESVVHWPLLMLPLVTVVASVVGGWYWAVTALLCVTWHYLHDALMMGAEGWGWFFRIRPAHWSRLGGEDPSFEDLDGWIWNNWFSFSPLLVREIGIGSIALSVAIGTVFGSVVAGVVTFLVLWAGTLAVMGARKLLQKK